MTSHQQSPTLMMTSVLGKAQKIYVKNQQKTLHFLLEINTSTRKNHLHPMLQLIVAT
jgi:hypothetical protein